MKKSKVSVGFSSPLLLVLFALSTGCSGTESEPPTEGEPANPWNGRTYFLEIPRVNWAEPRGIGADIADYVPGFLLKVEGDAPETFEVMMGKAHSDGAQNTCNKTGRLSASAEPPGVTIGPSEFPMHIEHAEEEIAVDGMVYDLTMTNVLPDGDSNTKIGEFTGTMDFRQLYELFTVIIGRTPELVCTSLEMTYQTPCAPCPTDQQPYCLTVKAIDLEAEPYDAEIEPIDAVDPSCVPPAP
jgi:hypothetical protein